MCSVHFRGEFFSSSHQFVKEAWTELIKCVPKFVLSRHGLCRIYTHFVANPILSQMSAVLGIHSKSEKVCGVKFSVSKNLRKKCVNFDVKISR